MAMRTDCTQARHSTHDSRLLSLRRCWSVRVIRLALTRGPLCRRSDRVEAAALLTAILLSLAALPLSVLTGTAVRDYSLVEAEEQAMVRRPSVATLLKDPETASLLPGQASSSAPVTWTTPNGFESHAAIEVSPTARRGSEVTVWTSPEGNLTTPPLTSSQVEARAAAAAAGSQLSAMVLVWIAFLGVRGGINRRRHQAWSNEWASISPSLEA